MSHSPRGPVASTNWLHSTAIHIIYQLQRASRVQVPLGSSCTTIPLPFLAYSLLCILHEWREAHSLVTRANTSGEMSEIVQERLALYLLCFGLVLWDDKAFKKILQCNVFSIIDGPVLSPHW